MKLDYSMTFPGVIKGEIIAGLLDASTPFQVEPYPDDFWRISVKTEAKRVLNDVCAKHTQLIVEMTVSRQRIQNAFTGAFEGGSNHWLHSATQLDNWKKPEGDRLVWWGHDEYWTRPDFCFAVHFDDPDKEEGNGEGYKQIRLEDVQKGLALMAGKSKDHFTDLLLENDDATTHDVMVQYVVLGEIVYG